MPEQSFLPYGRQDIDEDDIAAVVDVLRGDWLTSGPKVPAFEGAFAEYCGAGHAVACANGTAALHLANLALDLGPDDHVIVPAISFLSTANAARFVGAEVVFADVDPLTGLMTPDNLLAALETARGKRLKAIFPVHLAGQPCDMPAIKAIADERGLRVVEDACHAVGTSYGAHSVGACAHSDMAAFSFHPVKTIATAEGGMVTTADPQLAERLRLFVSHGMSRNPETFVNHEMAFDGGEVNPWHYEMQVLGFNYRLTDVQCALGLSQLRRLPAFLARRAHLVSLYRQALAPLAPGVRLMPAVPDARPGWHLAVAHVDFAGFGTSRGKVMRALREAGIGTQVHYIPIPSQPYYKGRYGEIHLPGAEAYFGSCLSLPLFPAMRDEQVGFVVETLRSVLEGSAG